MHIIQEALLGLAEDNDVAEMKLSELARLLNVKHLQLIKHHRGQLIDKGLIPAADNSKKVTSESLGRDSKLIRIPVLGSANAGPASIYIDGQVQGYLRVSASLLPKSVSHKALYALKVIGRSMNRAQIGPQKLSAESGDYVIADGGTYEPKTNDYVISAVDGKANIKKLLIDNNSEQVALISESTEDFPPIIIEKSDELDSLAQSKIIHVVKPPRATT